MLDDASLLPFPEAERPTGGKTALAERLEGKQIAWAHVMPEPGPTGSPVLGLEFTDASRLLVMAARDTTSRYRARLLFRFLEPPLIITARMARYFGMGRDGQRGQVPPGGRADAYERAYVRPDTTPSALERGLEGERIRGVRMTIEPTAWVCEQTEIELASGARLYLAADHQAKVPYRAELIADLRVPTRRLFGQPERRPYDPA